MLPPAMTVRRPCEIIRLMPARHILRPRCMRSLASTALRQTPARGTTRKTSDRNSVLKTKAVPSSEPILTSGPKPQNIPRTSASASSLPPTAQNTTSANTTRPTDVQPTTKTTATATARKAGKQGPAPLERKSEKLAYPERLLIYHAGTGRTIFLSCTKLSGIFLFIFTGVFIAPAYYFSPMEPTYLAFVYLAGSCIPLALMTFTTAPFVTYVHLGLPVWARHSAARLQRFTQSLPSSAEIDVTSLRWIWPRVTRMNASELYFHKGSVTGALTLRREVPKHVQEVRKWYAWRPITKFYVGGKAGTKSAEPWAWQGVLDAIARGFPRSTVERKR